MGYEHRIPAGDDNGRYNIWRGKFLQIVQPDLQLDWTYALVCQLKVGKNDRFIRAQV